MQIYFHSRLCSYLSRVPILVEGTVSQQHMTDRTEQERLLLYFIAQKYFKTKGSNTEWHKMQCASRAENDALETTVSVTARRLRSPLSPHRKEKYRGKIY